MEYCIQMLWCGVIYTPRFMQIDADVQAILSFRLWNSRGCNVGVTDGGGGDFMNCWDRFRCQDTHTKFHKDWFRCSDVNSMSQMHLQRARWFLKTTSIFPKYGKSAKCSSFLTGSAILLRWKDQQLNAALCGKKSVYFFIPVWLETQIHSTAKWVFLVC